VSSNGRTAKGLNQLLNQPCLPYAVCTCNNHDICEIVDFESGYWRHIRGVYRSDAHSILPDQEVRRCLTFKAERTRPASVASGSKILLKPIVRQAVRWSKLCSHLRESRLQRHHYTNWPQHVLLRRSSTSHYTETERGVPFSPSERPTVR